MTNKSDYRELCRTESMPVFMEAWWLDAVASSDWDVTLVRKGGQIVAAMPYTKNMYRFGLVYIGQPSLTQHLGPWIRPSNAKYAKQLSREKDLMNRIIDQLPHFSSFNQNWSYRNQNWLPFYWRGYSQTTSYTYVIPDLTDLDEVFSQFQEKVRTDIRKSVGRNQITICDSSPIEELLALNKKTFSRQSLNQADSDDFISNLVAKADANKCIKWFIAKGADNVAHAGVLIVWDKQSAYYLIGGGDPELRNSGATSLCIWEAIKFASTVTKSFDFEGSMLEPVERFVRGFGAKQMPYFSISYTPSRLLKVAKLLKGLR